jgi:signal transduction histidine kinase
MANIGEPAPADRPLSGVIHAMTKRATDEFTLRRVTRTMRRVAPLRSLQRTTVTVPYRGQDRRALIAAGQSATGRPFFVAGFGLAVLTAVVFAVNASEAVHDNLSSVAASFELSAGALGIVAATLGVVRWRLAGDARALWVATAVGTYSVLSIALVQLLLQLYTDAAPRFAWIHPASLVVALALFGTALRTHEVDARLQPVITFALAVAGFAVTGLIMAVTPINAWLADSAAARQSVLSSVIALAWAGFATAYIIRGMRDGRVLFAWFGLTMFGLTLAELTRALTYPTVSDLALGSAVIRCIALLFAVIGVTRELQLLFASQSSRLLNTMVDTLSSHASLQAAQERQEELAHEARNALTAIEGATQTLERFRDNLDDETRRALALAVSDEIGRLQRLVSASQRTNHPVAFRLSDIVRPQIDLVRAQGAQVDAKVPGDIVVYGRPADFAEVLQNLLVNARVHGRNPITVRATHKADHVVVRVEDRGPGVPPAVRSVIFDRGRRASDAPGSGLGLYLSRQLMVEQNGSLWVEDRVGGGASFAVAIPVGPAAVSLSFSDSGRLERITKNRDNGGKPANGHRTLDAPGAQRAEARPRARFRKPEQPID